jgi:nitroreductase
MNETLKVIRERRSVRKFIPDRQIPDADIEAILEAAIYAPSAVNQQIWHFTVIRNPEILNGMANVVKEGIIISGRQPMAERAKAPGYSPMYHAPTLLMITADAKARWAMLDCGAAVENAALAAQSLGISSCVMAMPGHIFDGGQGPEWRQKLGLPDGYDHVISLALGYVEGEAPAAPARKRDEVINYVR